MRKTLLSLVLILASFTGFTQAQTGGEISARDNSANRGVIYRNGTMLKTWDSTSNVWLSPLKLKTDSIYTVLNAGIRTTLDSTTQRSTVKISGTVPVSGTFWQATQPVSGTVTSTVDSNSQRKTIKVSELPSIAITNTAFAATIDTSTYAKKSIKVSELPSITIANTAFTANAGTNLNTSALALESGGNLANINTNIGYLPNGIASTTSGQKGTLVLTATTTSAPTYTTATSNPLSTTTTGALRVDGSAVTQPISIAAPTTIYNGKKTVTTAGTRVTLASSQAVRSVCIKALQSNTGYIYVGDGSVSSTTGIQLLAGDTISLDISNLNTIYIDSSVSGEGVTYISSN